MANKCEKKFHYGGQAIIEGVMMRGPSHFAVAVRNPKGEIVTSTEDVESILGKLKFLDKPFLRGTLALIDAMVLGIKALMFSANVAMEGIQEEAKLKSESEADDKSSFVEGNSSQNSTAEKKGKINDITIGITMFLGLALGVSLFLLVPIIIVKPFKEYLQNWQLTAFEGIVKISLFLAYVLVISLMKDIRRVFQYHGAEHKTINAFEAQEELTIDNVEKYSKVHVRCGTSFILVVLLTSIILFALIID